VAERRAFLLTVLWILPAILLTPAGAFADYVAIGRFQYEDRGFDLNGFTGINPRPIRHADVRILANGQFRATGTTGEDGTFFHPGSLFGCGRADGGMRHELESHAGTPTRGQGGGNGYSFGDFYSVASAPAHASGSGIVNFGETLAEARIDTGKFFNIWDVAIDAMQFCGVVRSQRKPSNPKAHDLWRSDHPDDGSFLSARDQPLHLRRRVIRLRRHGHQPRIRTFHRRYFFTLGQPGRAAFHRDNAQDMRLAWSEGLATYLGCSARKHHGYDRPEIYSTPTEPGCPSHTRSNT